MPWVGAAAGLVLALCGHATAQTPTPPVGSPPASPADPHGDLSRQANNPNVLQVGKVLRMGRHGLSLSAEGGPWVVHPDPPYPAWGVRVGVGLLFPGVTIGKPKHR